MGKVLVQFYASAPELSQLIESWRKKFGLRLVFADRSSIFDISEVRCDETIKDLCPVIERASTIFLGLDEPNLEAASVFDFLQKNRGFLTLNVGKLLPSGLTESSISGITEDPTLLRIWKSLVQDLKKSTKAGLWAIHTGTGAKTYYKSLHYTPGAADLSLHGTALLSDAKWVLLSVVEP